MRVPRRRVAGLVVIAFCAAAAPAAADGPQLTANTTPVTNAGSTTIDAYLPSGTEGSTVTFTATGGTVFPETVALSSGHATTTFTSQSATGRSVTATVDGAGSQTLTFPDRVALSISSLTHDAAGNLVATVLPGDTAVDPSSCLFTSQFNTDPPNPFPGSFEPAPGDPRSGKCVASIYGGLPTTGYWQLTAAVLEQDGDKATFTVSSTDPVTPPPSNPLVVPPVGPALTRVDANALLLQCAKSSVAITDISKRSGSVRIAGLTSPANAGADVDIAFSNANNVVAVGTVAANGSFQTTAPMPSKSIANTDRARYRAKIGTSTTPWVKLTRRLSLTGLHVDEGDLAIGGRLSKPLVPGARVIVSSQSDCSKPPTVIGHLQVASDGSFNRVIALPETVTGFVASLTATVRSPGGGRFVTNAIPRAIQVR